MLCIRKYFQQIVSLSCKALSTECFIDYSGWFGTKGSQVQWDVWWGAWPLWSTLQILDNVHKQLQQDQGVPLPEDWLSKVQTGKSEQLRDGQISSQSKKKCIALCIGLVITTFDWQYAHYLMSHTTYWGCGWSEPVLNTIRVFGLRTYAMTPSSNRQYSHTCVITRFYDNPPPWFYSDRWCTCHEYCLLCDSRWQSWLPTCLPK